MSELPRLSGERVTLRPPQPTDAAERAVLGRDPEIVRMFGGDTPSSRLLSEGEAAAWYATIERDPLLWVIEHERRFIGTVRLYGFHELELRAQVAIGILDPALLGRGLGTEAMQLVLAYAFETLALYRISLRVLSFNERAIRSYEKCGFVREGVEREAALIDGVRQDDVIMGLLRREWLAPR